MYIQRVKKQYQSDIKKNGIFLKDYLQFDPIRHIFPYFNQLLIAFISYYSR